MKVSVIIPVKNEEGSIKRLLDSLWAQSRRPDEIVITDGGSEDHTIDFIQSYRVQGLPIVLAQDVNAFPGRGRNLAIQRARHELLAFIDAGNVAHPLWLEKLLEAFQEGKSVDVVYGTYEPVVDTFFKKCASLVYVEEPWVIRGHWMRPYNIKSSLMKRCVWETIGGFREDLRSAEDLLFVGEITKHSFHVAYAPDALIWWEMQPGFRTTFSRFNSYAYFNIQAGLAREWNIGILKHYSIALAFLLLCIFFHPLWLAPMVGYFMARAVKYTYFRRNPSVPVRNLSILLGVMGIMFTVDIASLLGTAKWVKENWKDALRFGRVSYI